MAKIDVLLIISLFFIYTNSLLFQDNLLRKFSEKEKDKNWMISPFSIYQFLSLLANGATGNTRNEVLQAFYPNKVIDNDTDTDALLNEINSNIKDILSNFASENIECPDGKDCKINIKDINALFIKNDVVLEDKFTKICEMYNTSYFELIGVKQINEYVSEQTNGKIDDVISLIPPDVSLILANIIYFKGAWTNVFNEGNTRKMEFLNQDKTISLINTMNKVILTEYYEDDKVQIISLPYNSHNLDFKMIIILPNSEKYPSPIDYLNNEEISLSTISSKLKNIKNIDLYLPKFKFNYSSLIRGLLSQIGIKSIFHSGEYDNLCKNKYIYMDDINHLTYIDVNENGTEAAAVTIMNFNGTEMPPEISMNINHSFIYMIQSNNIKDPDGNDMIPFFGIVNNLTEEESKGEINNNNNTHDMKNDENSADIRSDENNADLKSDENSANIKSDENSADIKSDANTDNIKSDENRDNIKSDENNESSTDIKSDENDDPNKIIPWHGNAKFQKINLIIIISLIFLIFF